MTALPIIHPLHHGDPLPRGPHGECTCNWCRHWSPLIKHIEAQLDDAGKALLDEYVSYVEQRIEDGDTAQAKLDGSWPGWSRIVEFKPEET